MVKRQRVPVQINQFIGGVNTEANPLSYPPNVSLDELNMVFNRDGSRSRRNGFDLEQGYNEVSTGIPSRVDEKIGRSQFRWDNTGGTEDEKFLVLQVGNQLNIHNLDDDVVSTTPIFTENFPENTYSETYGYAIVDGTLIVANGQRGIKIIQYDGTNFTSSITRLLVRDLFGVESTSGGVETTDTNNIQVRPNALSDTHLYNLRNQTFALPRVKNDNTKVLVDLVEEFEDATTDEGNTVFPSNADNAIKFILPNANSTSDREVERFFADTMIKSPPSTSTSPIGYFIIDALHRGASRIEQEQKLRDLHPQLTKTVTTLQEDRTPGGANVLAQYSGRVWYAGFSSRVVGQHKKSPKMSSYILFSKVVQEPSDINLCYQEADPTSVDDPNIVDTDGGFIKIDGAYNIKALIPVDTSLFVLAENGVWRVVGIDGNTFTATSYTISKITDQGCISPKSAIVADKTLMFWGYEGIYRISTDQVGLWAVANITQETIQTYYDNMPNEDKKTSIGVYDADNLTIRWVWGMVEDVVESNELILNLKYGSFTKNVINLPQGVGGIAGIVQGEGVDSEVSSILTGSLTNSKVLPEALRIVKGLTKSYYHVILNTQPTISYSIGQFNRTDTTYDWTRYGSPTDTPAFLLTGPVTGGDGRLRKSIPYLTVYFQKTEAGLFSVDSRCTLTAQWDWSRNFGNGRWSSPRQIYRVNDKVGLGAIFPTRNKIRGSGNSISFRFDSEEGFGMYLYGWEFNVEANTEQ